MRALALAMVASCFAACIPVAVAQNANPAMSREAPARLVERAERIWAEALVSKDLQQLAGVLDQRFRLITLGVPGSTDYEGYLRQQGDPDRAYRAMTPTHVSVSVSGDIAVAVVTMRVGWPDGFERPHRNWQFTDTWIRADGEWRVVARVSQPVQPV